jgi:hypothetical protein
MENAMSDFWNFINSNFFIALVTLGAGSIAYVLYKKNKKDGKKDAANIVLLEIQNAERLLEVAKERMRKDNVVEDNAYVMPTESWSKYKYMFVRDFDRDEWDSIGMFFERCRLYDEAVAHKSASFKKNEAQIRTNMQRVTSDYLKELVDDPPVTNSKRQKIVDKIDNFQNEYINLRQDLNQYTPIKPTTDAKVQLDGINENISQTSIGTKFKELAGIKLKTN